MVPAIVRIVRVISGAWILVFVCFQPNTFSQNTRELYDVGPDPISSELPARDLSGNQDPNRENGRDIIDLDIDQLTKTSVQVPSLNMEVSTVSRTESTVDRSPAAVFVITNEMIKRSGARNIPEVLRLAPGVDVGRCPH